ncbi:hypothetical protein [Bacillus vallismortis]|nr:hypothetical protein [Bacillus vallismortis]MCO4852529.1 hypothetical protein [Bacillus vallismortis]
MRGYASSSPAPSRHPDHNISLDIMNIIVREQWGITYPFEYENIGLS